jgi:hypothetical protein
MALWGPKLIARRAAVDTWKMLKPDFASQPGDASGCVTHDEKGNAVWNQSPDTETLPVLVERLGLTVAKDEAPVDALDIKRVPAEAGFDPYESGLVEKTESKPRPDLRELSNIIKMRNQRGNDNK